MVRQALIITVITFAAISGTVFAAQAQRVTSSQVEKLENKVKAQQEAYYRFELAENEAQDEGAPDKAATYREAKVKAQEAYNALNAQLQKLLVEKQEQDKRQAELNKSN